MKFRASIPITRSVQAKQVSLELASRTGNEAASNCILQFIFTR